MSAIGRCKWYFAALALLLAATVADTIAKHFAGSAAMTIAESVGKATRDQSRQVANLHLARSGVWQMCGIALALLGLACWLVSYRKSEPCPQSVPLVLVVAYLLWFMLAV
jgi:hypothetical protein